jgi:mannosyltransferase
MSIRPALAGAPVQGELAMSRSADDPARPASRSLRQDRLLLAGILLLALALRLVGLDAPLWYDEIVTLDTHLRLPWGAMMSAYSMNHHYLFSLEAKAAIALFGEAPWVLRLPALLFGLASIWAMWALARREAGRRAAHLTALLLALSYHHIWFSQNARGYTELMFWSVLGTSLFLAGLRGEGRGGEGWGAEGQGAEGQAGGRRGIWAGYAAVLALAIYTHLTGALVFVAHGLVWLAWLAASARAGRVERARHILLPAAGFLGGGLLTLLLYAPVLPGVMANALAVAGTSAVDVMQEYQNPLWTLLEAARSLTGADALPQGLGTAIALAVALAAVGTVLAGAFRLHVRTPLLAPIVLLHILLTLGLLLGLGMRIWPRFFFVDIGFLMLLAVAGAEAIAVLLARLAPGRPAAGRDTAGQVTAGQVTAGQVTAGRGTGWLFGLAAAAMVLASAGLALRNYAAPKQDLAGAWRYVEGARAPGDPVYALGVAGPLFHDFFAADWTPVGTDAELAAALAAPGRAWLVVAFPTRSFRALAGLKAAIDRDFELARRFPGTLGDGAVLVFARRRG